MHPSITIIQSFYKQGNYKEAILASGVAFTEIHKEKPSTEDEIIAQAIDLACVYEYRGLVKCAMGGKINIESAVEDYVHSINFYNHDKNQTSKEKNKARVLQYLNSADSALQALKLNESAEAVASPSKSAINNSKHGVERKFDFFKLFSKPKTTLTVEDDDYDKVCEL